MTKEEKWRRLFEAKEWLDGDVIRAKGDFSLQIVITGCSESGSRQFVTTDAAMIETDFDLLCYEDGQGTVFFDWDDIVQVKVMPTKQRKGWL